MTDSRLNALSPLDGRYADKCADLAALFSESGLIARRVRVEAAWFGQLAASGRFTALARPSAAVDSCLASLARGVDEAGVARVKAIERETNHDVKAVEYFVRERLAGAGAAPAALEFVHFACTSEDINNLAYALMLAEARERILLPAIAAVQSHLAQLADRHASLAMLSRTHGQAASPTTLGKEAANFAARLARGATSLASVEILGKFNGAVGCFNAHVAADPGHDWRSESRRLVAGLGLAVNDLTTQIEPHDWIAAYCDALARANTILVDLCRDAWGYVSLGYFAQKAVAGEVGSSTMPHKVNPIAFENAEGNAGLANAMLRHFSEKLPVSRWQRDLTDSTVMRNLGAALGHSLLAWRSALAGLERIEPDAARRRRPRAAPVRRGAPAARRGAGAAGAADARLVHGPRRGARALALRRRMARTEVECARADWRTHRSAIESVRRLVFIDEQGIPERDEFDGEDAGSIHVLARLNRDPVGTGRLNPAGKIGRIAVIAGQRGRGVGTRILRRLLEEARLHGFRETYLHAQVQAVPFYERLGFSREGEVFDEAGIPHVRMSLVLE